MKDLIHTCLELEAQDHCSNIRLWNLYSKDLYFISCMSICSGISIPWCIIEYFCLVWFFLQSQFRQGEIWLLTSNNFCRQVWIESWNFSTLKFSICMQTEQKKTLKMSRGKRACHVHTLINFFLNIRCHSSIEWLQNYSFKFFIKIHYYIRYSSSLEEGLDWVKGLSTGQLANAM